MYAKIALIYMRDVFVYVCILVVRHDHSLLLTVTCRELLLRKRLPNVATFQQNLKCLRICNVDEKLTNVISSITNLPNILIKLGFERDNEDIPLSFLTKFTHLQELVLSFLTFTDF